MTETARQLVTDVTDETLRRLIHDHLKVFAKFTADNCAICESLALPFVNLADDAGYEGILFVRLNAAENPVAKHLMAEKAAPFFVSYCQGRLLECDNQTTEAGMLDQLARLRQLLPQVA